MLLVFVTTGEGWVEKMEMAMRATTSAWPGLIFFLVFYLVSFYMLYNLFIGVILEEFELTDEDKQALQLENLRQNMQADFRRRQKGTAKFLRSIVKKQRSGAREGGTRDGEGLAAVLPLGVEVGDGEDDRWILGCLPPPPPSAGKGGAPQNLRGYARAIASDVLFERGILVTIFVSAVVLAMESPVATYSSIDPEIAVYIDYAFFIVFLFEFVVKVLEYGLYWEHATKAYFRQAWNQLDFFILVFQLLDIIGVDGLKSIRVMRVLRPLRLLNKIKSLQQLLLSIQASAADMLNVLFLWLFMCLVFSICAVNLFSGKLHACNDGDFVGWPLNPGEAAGSEVGWRENCVGTYFTASNEAGSSYVADSMPTSLLKPRVWSNPADGASGLGWHFDNFAMAFQTLFEVSTFEQWSDYVYSCVDATQIGQQPILWNMTWHVVFFHLWVVMSCFFVLQLVIGVLIDAINQKSGAALCVHAPLFLSPLVPYTCPCVLCVRVRVRASERIFACMHVWMDGWMCASLFLSMYVFGMCVLHYICKYIYIYICIHTYTCVFRYTDLQRNWMRMKLRMAQLKPMVAAPVPEGPVRYRFWVLANNEILVNGVTGVIVVNIFLMASESYAQPK